MEDSTSWPNQKLRVDYCDCGAGPNQRRETNHVLGRERSQWGKEPEILKHSSQGKGECETVGAGRLNQNVSEKNHA